MIEIRNLGAEEARRYLPDLARVLADCVAGGASVSFMAPFSLEDAAAFFAKSIESVERGERFLLAGFVDGKLRGTVQVVPAPQPNQPHRADIAKLLVHREARGQGLAARLMLEAEAVSRAAGRTLLVLDTVTGSDAERLYQRLGQ